MQNCKNFRLHKYSRFNIIIWSEVGQMNVKIGPYLDIYIQKIPLDQRSERLEWAAIYPNLILVIQQIKFWADDCMIAMGTKFISCFKVWFVSSTQRVSIKSWRILCSLFVNLMPERVDISSFVVFVFTSAQNRLNEDKQRSPHIEQPFQHSPHSHFKNPYAKRFWTYFQLWMGISINSSNFWHFLTLQFYNEQEKNSSFQLSSGIIILGH